MYFNNYRMIVFLYINNLITMSKKTLSRPFVATKQSRKKITVRSYNYGIEFEG